MLKWVQQFGHLYYSLGWSSGMEGVTNDVREKRSLSTLFIRVGTITIVLGMLARQRLTLLNSTP